MGKKLTIAQVQTLKRVPYASIRRYLDSGARRTPTSSTLAEVKGLDPDKLLPAAQFGCDKLCRPYDASEIGRIVARIGLGIGRKQVHDNSYICSELVYECLKRAGVTIKYNGSGFVSPEDIWRDRNLQLLTRIL